MADMWKDFPFASYQMKEEVVIARGDTTVAAAFKHIFKRHNLHLKPPISRLK
jgi:hypothetical protein